MGADAKGYPLVSCPVASVVLGVFNTKISSDSTIIEYPPTPMPRPLSRVPSQPPLFFLPWLQRHHQLLFVSSQREC